MENIPKLNGLERSLLFLEHVLGRFEMEQWRSHPVPFERFFFFKTVNLSDPLGAH